MAHYLSMECRSGSVGCSGLRSLVWLIWMLARAAVISRLAWAAASISRMVHSPGQQVGVGCWWDASVPLYGPLHRAAEDFKQHNLCPSETESQAGGVLS